MMKLKTLIVEDDLMASKLLERLCSKNENVDLIQTCSNAKDGLKLLEKHEIDMLLLDIEMPGMTGIELLDQIPYVPQVVFTTARKEYAFEAFEYDVADFLKKPITAPRFTKAVEKVIDNINQLSQSSSFSASNELYIKQDGQFIRVPYASVLYFENVGDYIKVFTETGNYIIYGALKAIDARLTYPGFLKVHRSYIVNLGKIKDIEDNTLVIKDKVIPISRAFKPILMKTINIITL